MAERITHERAVRLLEIRYADSPEGPWGEPAVRDVDPTEGRRAPNEWGMAFEDDEVRDEVTQVRGGNWYQTRVVEYVPLDQQSALDSQPVETVDESTLIHNLRALQRAYADDPSGKANDPLAYGLGWDELDELLDVLRSRQPAQPPPLSAEVVEIMALLNEAFELLLQFDAQWGSENISKKYGFRDEFKALVKRREAISAALRSLIGKTT